MSYKSPIIPVNTTVAKAGISIFPAAEDHDHGISGSGLDHGLLNGLNDDDHAQYALSGTVGSSRLTMNTARLLGRTTASAGAVEEITVGSGLSLSAGALTATGGGMAIGGTVTSGTTGSVLLIGAGPVLAQDNTNFFWDISNHRLGLGLTSPNEQLELTGNIRLVASTSTAGIIKSGSNSLLHTVGTQSVFLGIGAGTLSNTGLQNVGIGYLALNSLTSGQFNLALGRASLNSLTSGTNNVAIGSNALGFVTTGSYNIAIGSGVMSGVTTANAGIGIGYLALQSVTSGLGLTAIGNGAGTAITSGSSIVAIGSDAARAMTTGSNVVAIGSNSLYNSILGYSNTAVGALNLHETTTGYENTAVGYRAGLANTTGHDNLFLGKSAGESSLVSAVQSAAIGAFSNVLDSNHIILGADTECVGIGTSSRRPTGTRGLIFSAGTALSAMAAGTAGLYAQTTAGVTHLMAIASNGTTVQLV